MDLNFNLFFFSEFLKILFLCELFFTNLLQEYTVQMCYKIKRICFCLFFVKTNALSLKRIKLLFTFSFVVLFIYLLAAANVLAIL